MMWLIVRLFFLVILASVILAVVLGWFALLRARAHLARNLGFGRKPADEYKGPTIEGEYKVIEDKEKDR